MIAASDLSHDFPAGAFRANDIRGTVPDMINPRFAHALGVAVGEMVREDGMRAVVTGRDARSSSVELSAALQAGIRASGVDVIDIGMATTAQGYFGARLTDAGTAVIVTGSHQPAVYNGFKVLHDGAMMTGEGLVELRTRMLRSSEDAEVYGRRSRLPVDSCYQARILSDVRLSRGIKVALDCGNGVGGVLAPGLLRALGCEVVELFCDADGGFPNHLPDPSNPVNLRDLIYCLRYTDCEVGLALDGDASRLGVVAKSGRIIWPDELLGLFARDLLSRRPGATIAYDVQCGRHLPSAIVHAGGVPLMTESGYSLVRRRMRENGALLGGEMSGHLIFSERWFGFDDGLYAAARLLELLARSSDPQGLLESLPQPCAAPQIRLPASDSEKFSVIDFLRAVGDFDGALAIGGIDGVRVEYPDGFGLARASNTQACLVLRFEADNAAALDRIQQQFQKQLSRIAPHMALPF